MVEPLIVIPGDVDQNRGFKVTYWHQYKNYECIYCQYATLFPEKMEKHQLEGRHPWAFPSQAVETEDAIDGAVPEY